MQMSRSPCPPCVCVAPPARRMPRGAGRHRRGKSSSSPCTWTYITAAFCVWLPSSVESQKGIRWRFDRRPLGRVLSRRRSPRYPRRFAAAPAWRVQGDGLGRHVARPRSWGRRLPAGCAPTSCGVTCHKGTLPAGMPITSVRRASYSTEPLAPRTKMVRHQVEERLMDVDVALQDRGHHRRDGTAVRRPWCWQTPPGTPAAKLSAAIMAACCRRSCCCCCRNCCCDINCCCIEAGSIALLHTAAEPSSRRCAMRGHHALLRGTPSDWRVVATNVLQRIDRRALTSCVGLHSAPKTDAQEVGCRRSPQRPVSSMA